MKAFLFVLLGAALFIAIMTYTVTHYREGSPRWIGLAVGTVVFAGFAFGPGLARKLFGRK